MEQREKWMVAAKKADFEAWAEKFRISPVVARILRNRDLTNEEDVNKFLYGSLQDLYSPWLLKDMDRAVTVIADAIKHKKQIRVIGDYDVDGVCSAYILTKGLAFLGAEVDAAIPHRIHDGYGLNEHLIDVAKEEKIELIVTCDNGIAAAEQIARAAELKMDVVVTDHHEVPFEEDAVTGMRKQVLPPARAVVDPKRPDCGYPFKGICGGVVAFKLVEALLETFSKETEESIEVQKAGREELLEELLEFAALATVCDVMELADENRILVKEGLKRMQNSRNIGLLALMEVNGIKPAEISAYHLGFVIGPCLNATGRLETAKHALELLQSREHGQAMVAAKALLELNVSRKNLTLEGVEKAEQYIREQNIEEDKILIVYLPEVHESLAGIIAGRIRERYNKPVFMLTKAEEGIKGSGRSIEGYHMFEALTRVKELFTRFGGHRLAAGLSMKEENLEEFRRKINENCNLTAADFIPVVHIDVPMPLAYATDALAEELSCLEPFGVGNPKPLFAQKKLCFTEGRKMGTAGNCARFKVQTPEGNMEQMVLFRNLEEFEQVLEEKYGPDSVRLLYRGEGNYEMAVAYQLSVNCYRGRREKQYIIQHFF